MGKGGSWRVIRLQYRSDPRGQREGGGYGGRRYLSSGVPNVLGEATSESMSQSSHQRSLPSLCLPGEVRLSPLDALSPGRAGPREGGLRANAIIDSRAQQLALGQLHPVGKRSETHVHGHTGRT